MNFTQIKHILPLLLFLLTIKVSVVWSTENCFAKTPKENQEVDLSPLEYDSNHINNFILSLSKPLINDVSVDYKTIDGTALANQDYIPSHGVATIFAGQTQTLIPIEIIGDTIAEETEVFSLQISKPKGAIFPIGASTITTTRTIIDDDKKNNLIALEPNTDPNINNKFYSNGNLNLPITIKETAGIGVKNHPVFVIIPLPQSRYFQTSEFKLVTKDGIEIPTQIEVVNKWWGNDNSLRHIKIYFNTTLNPFTTCNSGTEIVYLRDHSTTLSSYIKEIQIEENDDIITINTGPLKFTVNKKQFSILEQVWLDKNNNKLFEKSEQILKENTLKGGIFVGRLAGDRQIDNERSDVKVIIEESGSQRVIIKAEALTHYNNTQDHQHGFAVRIYAYAGKPFVKIDYQLQNSSKDSKYAWPLYFEEMNINLPLIFTTEPTVTIGNGTATAFKKNLGDGIEIAQESHDIFKIREKNSATGVDIETGSYSEGFIDISDQKTGMTAIIRNFWQMWPNGLSVDSSDNLSIQLFPEWSAQWHKDKISDTGLYWLQDMQHIYKEILLNFHNGTQTTNEKINLAKTFQSYPVVTIPTEWYQTTRATLDMGGFIPIDKKKPSPDKRLIEYPKNKYNGQYYMFNWVNFGAIEPGHRVRSCTTGGWPTSVSSFIATENPSDYFVAELFALDEINIRPQSLSSYNFQKDFNLLKLTDNPYCGATWRAFEGHGKATHDAPLLEGTGINYYARDEAHGWHYTAEESYYFTGNLWVKDWYQFMAQYKRTRLNNLDPFESKSQRAIGHALATALQAFRITGDLALLKTISQFISGYLRKKVIAETGGIFEKDAAFMAGYLLRAIISYMYEVENSDPQAWAEAFQLVSGVIIWNYQYCNFCYHSSTTEPFNGISSGTGLTFTDPQAWYGWITGQQKYLNHLNKYLSSGINGGSKSFGSPTNWQGDFNGRLVQLSQNLSKKDTIAPNRITNLSSQKKGNDVFLRWGGKLDIKRYHIIWSNKPLLAEPSFDTSKTNWFAANVVGQFATTEQQQYTKLTNITEKIYIAVYAFDASGNISLLSNIVEQQ